jgi:putative membrane protein
VTTAAAVLAIIAGLAHVAVFVAESLLWSRPAVHRRFGAANAEVAQVQGPVFFNIGFYNLFLGIGAIVGGALLLSTGAITLALYTCLFMTGAGVVLLVQSPALWRGAVLQAGAPAVACLLILAS